jgi:putative phosphoribosyl transferase
MSLFANRINAGKRLAEALKPAGKDAIVLAIPRGGVVVGYEVAHALNLPLDVIITKKISVPDNPELAIGAVAEDGTAIIDQHLVRQLAVPKQYLDEEAKRQTEEIRNRLKIYRGDTPYPRVLNREVILIDDGVATGSTLRAALKVLKGKGAKSVTVAVPVGPPDTIAELKHEADRVVCLLTPEPFYAIGQFYENFDQTSHEEVTRLLKRRRQEMQAEEVKA